jgi:hypothetical protein
MSPHRQGIILLEGKRKKIETNEYDRNGRRQRREK